jgi:hypothetical protein
MPTQAIELLDALRSFERGNAREMDGRGIHFAHAHSTGGFVMDRPSLTQTAPGERRGRADEHVVRHFRQILMWPLQLMPIREGAQIQKHWEVLEQAGPGCPWHEVVDEFTGDPAQFQERHYSEFVTFLPHVQRFLYGEGATIAGRPGLADSPIRVFRRSDVVSVRLTHAGGEPAQTFSVAHVDLYFFYDLDVVILVVEIYGADLGLARAQDTLHRFGRAYPRYWDATGAGHNCLERVEWLSAAGEVLAVSDYERREKYLGFVCQYRSPCIASHWEYLLRPLALHHSGAKGPIRYRQLEYYRMPVLAYLALDDPHRLSRADFVRLGLVTAPGASDAPPFWDEAVRNFEARYCSDRHWCAEPSGPSTRFLCSGEALVVVGSATERSFTDPEVGVLGQFRHQYLLLFLIAHLHKAALLMISDRLVATLTRLDIHDPESVRRFKRAIRQLFEIFLRFTHRYWFHDVSDQVQAKELFRMCREHLGTERLFEEIRQETQDMSDYLDSDSLRRQANTVVRLTVVTAAGLIGTITTGFIGMNLIAAAEEPFLWKLGFFVLILVPTTFLTLYAVAKSKRLSDFLETLSDERLPRRAKLAALASVWAHKRDARAR